MHSTYKGHEIRHEKNDEREALCLYVNTQMNGVECTGHQQEWYQNLTKA